MPDVLLYILIGLAVLVIGFLLYLGVGFLIVRKDPSKAPQIFGPLLQLLLKNKTFRDKSQEVMAKQLAQDPTALQEAAREQMGSQGAKQLENLMKGRSEAQQEELLNTVMQKAESGQQITLEDLQRKGPRNANEARQQNKKKSKNRSKNKAAAKARKKNR